MYMNRTQHLQRPSALEQQPECRRPMTAISLAPVMDSIAADITVTALAVWAMASSRR